MQPAIQGILDIITAQFQAVKGIQAIVLGGSRATGSVNPKSDIDIGIYYDPTIFDLPSFKHQAALLDDDHRPDAIVDTGAWGQWINGGGWLMVQGVATDILFRDTTRVTQVLDDCLAGRITIDFQSGHPFGFVNTIYMGEVYYCQPLLASTAWLAQQKAKLTEFPKRYQQAAIGHFMWECEFSVLCGKKGLPKQDTLYVAGSLYRCVMSLIQVLYAINALYMLNEKGSLERLAAEGKQFIPQRFVDSIHALWTTLDRDRLATGFDYIEIYMREIKAYLAQHQYL